MSDFEKNIINLKSIIDTQVEGICLLIKIMNYSELKLMNSDLTDLSQKLQIIVKDAALELEIIIQQIQIGINIILVIPHINKNLLNELTHKICTRSQLYSDDQLPEIYLNCQISSMSFKKETHEAEAIYCILDNMLSAPSKVGYHKKYDKEIHSLDAIRFSNLKINYLRRALADKTLSFAYQPIIDSKTGHIPYYECLLRVRDENNNLTSVGPIIPKIELNGLINVVDHTVLKMVVKELVNQPNISLSANISNIGIVDNHLLNKAMALLERYDVADRLIIEITETALNEDFDQTKIFINSLRKYGCKFALDDFGSGFTSFNQLQNLPIDIIKIDGSYIKNIINDPCSKFFVEALVRISEDLGIKTVAEFVENGEIAKFIIDIRVGGMQGNFFSPAVNNL